MNTTSVATAVQRRWACHTRTVLPTDAYERQRCNVVLSACSVVYLWYMSCAVCSLRGQRKQTKFYRYIRTFKIGLIQRHTGNRLIHSRRKRNFERTPRELQRSDRAPTSTTGSGRPSCVDVHSGLAKSACTKRYYPKQTENFINLRVHMTPTRRKQRIESLGIRIEELGVSKRRARSIKVAALSSMPDEFGMRQNTIA